MRQDSLVFVVGLGNPKPHNSGSTAYLGSKSDSFITRMDISKVYNKFPYTDTNGTQSSGCSYKLIVPFTPVKVSIVSVNLLQNQVCAAECMTNSPGAYGSSVKFIGCLKTPMEATQYLMAMEHSLKLSKFNVSQLPQGINN